MFHYFSYFCFMGKAIFKFNNGNASILCSNCDKVVKTGKDFTEKDWSGLEGKGDVKSIYCDDCKDKVIDLDEIMKEPNTNLGHLKYIVPMLAENPEFKENLIKIISEKMFNNININDGK